MGRGLEIVTLGLMLGIGSIVSADPGLGTVTAPSCRALFKRSKLPEAKEVQIAIGGQHGAFYRVHSEWLTPVFEFVRWGVLR